MSQNAPLFVFFAHQRSLTPLIYLYSHIESLTEIINWFLFSMAYQ